jgi:hypothetical protein
VGHVKACCVKAFEIGSVVFGGEDGGKAFQRLSHEVGEVGVELLAEFWGAGEDGGGGKFRDKVEMVEEGGEAPDVVVVEVGDEDGLGFLHEVLLDEAGIDGKAAIYEEGFAFPGEEGCRVSQMYVVGSASPKK